jgi:homoserine dehydrogenase
MSVKIALLGFGTVGQGTYRALTLNAGVIKSKTGLELKVTKILEKNPAATESGVAPRKLFTQNYDDILSDNDIQIVVEMMGGVEPASSFMLQALKTGKSVVTPNKDVVAKNFQKLHLAAKNSGALLKYEAAVGGAIPVINSLSGPLIANSITKIQGIVNGTTNYILTKMEEDGLSYEEALKRAQAKGFAEADPTSDVEGIDAANKLTILIAEAWKTYIPPTAFKRVGITGVSKQDLKNAKEKACKIKLIASAEMTKEGIVASVQPQELPMDSPLAGIKNEFNGILISCNMAGDIFLSGKGAGMDPTGSAVAGDIIEIARHLKNGI